MLDRELASLDNKLVIQKIYQISSIFLYKILTNMVTLVMPPAAQNEYIYRKIVYMKIEVDKKFLELKSFPLFILFI